MRGTATHGNTAPGPVRRVRISEMTLAQLPAVLAIERRCFDRPWSEQFFRQELEIPFSRTIVACSEPDGRVVGYLCRWLVGDEVHLLNLAVDPGYRRCGVARRLMAVLLREARSCNVSSVSLEVRRGNLPAITLYRNLGFTEVGVRHNYYGRGEDAIIMRRDLR